MVGLGLDVQFAEQGRDPLSVIAAAAVHDYPPRLAHLGALEAQHQIDQRLVPLSFEERLHQVMQVRALDRHDGVLGVPQAQQLLELPLNSGRRRRREGRDRGGKPPVAHRP